MSACSSQLSASLLGTAVDEADSASTVHLTKQRQPRSGSAGKLHSSSHTVSNSRSSRHAATSSSQPWLRASNKAASNPATPRSPALPAESVASQGHRAASSPQSSASTNQSRASSGSNINHKPRWQQSTAASSRHQQVKASHQSSKPSFLTRLQAQEGQSVPEKQQQHAAKAAEMKAKLQEWRQQQKQQKQRLAQKPAPVDALAPSVIPVKKPTLQQHSRGGSGRLRADPADLV